MQGKASRKELARMKKKIEQGLVPLQNAQTDKSAFEGSINRVHLRCLACDRIMNAPPELDGMSGGICAYSNPTQYSCNSFCALL